MPTWPEMLNTLSCAILLAFLLPVAHILSPREKPFHAAGLLILVVLLFLQVAAPFWELTDVGAHTALLHVTVAVTALLTRKRWWLFIRVELGDVTASEGAPFRRVDDLPSTAVEGPA